MQEQLNYYHLSREEWRQFYRHDIAPLSRNELENIKAFNDRISLEDVEEIYIPLVHLLKMYEEHYQRFQQVKTDFMHFPPRPTPFIIGIAGSVAVGKSTTARVLSMILSRVLTDKKVRLITTDGFLYPNAQLEKMGIMERKGFPESYDMEALITFLDDVKDALDVVQAPVYSHEVYDIVPDEFEEIDFPDILIVEGINVLQSPANQNIYISDFFDFSIYVDAEPENIERWYLERFGALLDTAFMDPTNYYYQYAMGNRYDAFKMAREVWRKVNLPNLENYILPTRNRADLILHKSVNHKINDVYLRKF